jgi:hypothetical protein
MLPVSRIASAGTLQTLSCIERDAASADTLIFMNRKMEGIFGAEYASWKQTGGAVKVARKKESKRRIKPSAIVRVHPAPERPWELDNEQLTILKNSVCKGASDVELQYCLTVARRYRLDPFRQQIWFIKRWDKNADNGHGGTGIHVWVPQVGIYGMAHIASRDHKDYGSFSLPEYGPPITIDVEGKKITGPEWCRVKAFKKGIAEPSYGEAWWQEYCPKKYDNTLFWRNMGHRMIAKCAKAQAMREAYPDLGGLYIPEEMERMSEDYTPSGRQITDANGFSPSGQPVTYEARQQMAPALDATAPHGHEPGSAKAKQAEATLARVEEEDRKLEQERKQKTVPSKPVEKQEEPEKPASMPQDKPRGIIELDLTSPNDPIIRGDIGDLLELIQKHCTAKWSGDWWHLVPADVATIHAMGQQLNFRVIEILPKQVSARTSSEDEQAGKGAVQGKAGAAAGPARTTSAPKTSGAKATPATKTSAAPTASPASSEPHFVKGEISQFTEKMTKGRKANPEKNIKARPSVPYLTVLIKTEKGSQWVSVFDHDLFPFINKAKDKTGEFIVIKSGDFWNLTGLKSLGGTEFEDGKIPVIQRNREPGGTLF